MKVNIEIDFQKVVDVPKTSYYKNCLVAWAPIIREALKARINACKTSLYDNRNRVFEVVDNEYIKYYKKNGHIKVYNVQSIKDMEECIEILKTIPNINIDKFTKSQIIQILKSLYWIDEDKYTNYEGWSFDEVYSQLINGLL